MKLDKASVVVFLYPLVVETSECHHVNIFNGRVTVMKKVRREGEERVTGEKRFSERREEEGFENMFKRKTVKNERKKTDTRFGQLRIT
jgi:hypothetical protein